jgi:hypothetical protein
MGSDTTNPDFVGFFDRPNPSSLILFYIISYLNNFFNKSLKKKGHFYCNDIFINKIDYEKSYKIDRIRSNPYCQTGD